MNYVLFAVIFFVGMALSDTWSDCSAGKGHITSINCVIGPTPVTVGKNITAKCKGQLSAEITGGQLLFDASYNAGGTWIPLPQITSGFCGIAVKCPVPPGPTDIGYTVQVPVITPPGEYKGTIHTYDQNKALLACVTFDYTIVS
mmetsp:Transcript_7278/g.7994  ORF Transcript_7278/g.7994 Transcript_7278/m.7994 type:complete len:144 (+) Transcript_7278:34-465(+)